jgi:PAT family beta-lactamase induction signal transducer AmpG|tara:strand:- start:4348 stop:5646 length:1299 start_codon:yes stop_codon:yes gene_type:complete
MNWILSENRYLRFFSFSVFYVAQGLPIGLISIALPAYLAEQGAGPGQIASFIAISGLPWGFKLLAGPVMDRFTFLPMGRRRPWVVSAQFGLLIAIVTLGTVPDPVNNMVLLTWVAFVVNGFAAVQDVAVDGMAIDVLPAQERGRANAFMAFGQVAGYSASAALSAMAMAAFGIKGATWILAIGIALIFVWSVAVRERERERILPWSNGEATPQSVELQADDWRSIFLNLFKVMFLRASILLVVMTFFWRMAAGFWISAAPVIVVQELGYESTDYSYWTAITGFISACIGLLVGPLIDRSGSQRILLFSLLGLACTHVFAGMNTSLWSVSWFPLVILSLDNLFQQAIFISFIAIHMNICWKQVSATQFAIYMAWSNLARSIGAWIYGQVEPFLTSGQVFLAMGLCCVIAAVLLHLVNLVIHNEQIERLDGHLA